jgi:hypothetical protein
MLYIVASDAYCEAGRNAANTKPQASVLDRVAVAAGEPAVAFTVSSTASFAFGLAGTESRSVHPLPAVRLRGLAVITVPINRSPFAVVATVPAFGLALVP